jgi:hypothetical protein
LIYLNAAPQSAAFASWISHRKAELTINLKTARLWHLNSSDPSRACRGAAFGSSPSSTATTAKPTVVSSGTLPATRSSAWIFSLVHARFAAIDLELDQQVIFWTYKACEAGTSVCEVLK